MVKGTTDKHMAVLDKPQIEKIQYNKLIFVRKFCMFQCTGSFFFQMNYIFQILQRKSVDTASMGPIFNFIYLGLNTSVMVMIIFSKCREGFLDLVYL